MRKVTRLILLLMVVASLATAFADGDDHERARRLHESGTIVPLEKVVAEVQAAYPDSKVLEATLKDKKHVLAYEIEIVDKTGVVRELYFDAHTGEFLRAKQE
jgi:uncharacterized membrane protein YkoI